MSDLSSLRLSPEQMRVLGHQVIEMLVEHFENLGQRPAARTATRATLEARLRTPLPEEGVDADVVLRQLREDVFRHVMHVDHPRFFAFVPSPSNFVSVMADALAAGFNVFAGTWLEASGPAELELVTLDWLRHLCGLPSTAGGLFVSGGSVANLTALAVARHVRLADRPDAAVIYGSDQTHSSIKRALRVLGFQPAQFRSLLSDDAFRLPLTQLRHAVEADRAAGKVPFCVIANAGTTNTGAVDPLPDLAQLCREEGLWLHADGAYGAAAVLCEDGRSQLRGLEDVDSLSLDPHKWLFQPYEIGCVLVREGAQLRDTFRTSAEYLQDLAPATDEVNFSEYGIQLTRAFRALKLWMSLMVFGLGAFRKAVAKGFTLARLAESHLREMPNWEVVTPAQMAIVTFRYVPPGGSDREVDAMNRRLVEEMIAKGFAVVSSTVLRGKTVLRMCTINPRTTEADIEETVQGLRRLAAGGET